MLDANTIRKFHLYAGCLFAPALVFFIVSGMWQVYRFNDAKKDGSYTPPAAVKILSEVHFDQRVKSWTKKRSKPFMIFVITMSSFLLATIAIGIRMAFQAAKSGWLVWACLAVGIILPVCLLRF
ncbi:MAG TPA: hypothetical protein VD913_02455 [bacterium]|nr:hypothetical protein [bacterium]